MRPASLTDKRYAALPASEKEALMRVYETNKDEIDAIDMRLSDFEDALKKQLADIQSIRETIARQEPFTLEVYAKLRRIGLSDYEKSLSEINEAQDLVLLNTDMVIHERVLPNEVTRNAAGNRPEAFRKSTPRPCLAAQRINTLRTRWKSGMACLNRLLLRLKPPVPKKFAKEMSREQFAKAVSTLRPPMTVNLASEALYDIYKSKHAARGRSFSK